MSTLTCNDIGEKTLKPSSASEEPDRQKVQREQALRKQRLGMAGMSYMLTLVAVLYAWLQALVPVAIPLGFAAFMIMVNLTFYLLVHNGFNLRFSDPSMTAAQMVLSFMPALWVMSFIESGQGRAIFLILAIVPAMYGILALNIRQFLLVGVIYLLFYGIAMFAIWYAGDTPLDTSLEIMQFLVLFVVVAQIALIGGFINQLRSKLANRNQTLKRTSAELAEAVEKIRELASRDALTGVFNRRHLIDVLSQETNRRNRSSGPYSLCLMDLDFFKKVNDTYGHAAGDRVLKAVAQATEQDLRTIDCFGRYGGEEFLVILPQTPLNGACIKAERIRQAIAGLDFSDISTALAVTVSIGVAENLDDEGFAETIDRADVALYRAKDKGRNRVESSQCELAGS